MTHAGGLLSLRQPSLSLGPAPLQAQAQQKWGHRRLGQLCAVRGEIVRHLCPGSAQVTF